MTYVLILATGLVCAAVATPLTLLALRFLDKPTPTPPAESAPAIKEMSGPERVDRIARRGRR